jgi:AraC family transcriptional regulator of adaptative response/methylated-DNA-[protein]-cysteine methyltransferase
MSERIRYTSARSSLGEVLIATSDCGLVAFEFIDQLAPAIDALRHRFPEATVEEDAAGLTTSRDALLGLLDRPACDPGLALDPRGSARQRRVWDALRAIPAGQTASYGEIAARLGMPWDAREVADACAANMLAILIPCHRVVKKDGTLSGYRWGVRRKRTLLMREQQANAFTLA